MSDSPGLVDFSIGLVNSVVNLPDGQVKYSEQFNLHKNCEINSAHQNIWGLVEMTFGFSLVNASYSLPKWQGVKMTFFAPCSCMAFSVYKVLPLACLSCKPAMLLLIQATIIL